jgi:adenine-specific DNA-methyltransferase
LEGELYQLENQVSLFEESQKERKAREKKINKLVNEIDLLKADIEEIESGKIYQNAFEWRFEFPEVLDHEGNFIGFDLIIGNPPYGVNLSNNEKQYFQQKFTHQDYQLDTYLLFIEKAFMIMKNQGEFSFIIPNTWLSNLKFKKIRLFVINNTKINTIAHYQKAVFEEAVVDTQALFFAKSSNFNEAIEIRIYENNQIFTTHFNSQYQWRLLEGETINIFLTNEQIFVKK